MTLDQPIQGRKYKTYNKNNKQKKQFVKTKIILSTLRGKKERANSVPETESEP